MKQTTKILVAGPDDATTARAMGILRDGGYAVDRPLDLALLEEEVRRIAPTVVLLFSELSTISPLEAIHALASLPENWRPGIILMTRKPDVALMEEALALGADDCLPSNLPAALLNKRMEDLVGRRDAEGQKSLAGAAKGSIESIAHTADVLAAPLAEDVKAFVVVKQLARLVEVDRCALLMVDGRGQTGRLLASHEAPSVRGLRIDLKRYPEYQLALETLDGICIEDVGQDPRMETARTETEKVGLASVLVEPLVFQQKAIGVLGLSTRGTARSFSQEEALLVRTFAHLTALYLGLSAGEKGAPAQQQSKGVPETLPWELSDQIDDLIEELSP